MYLIHIDFDGYKFLVTLFRQLGKICVYVKGIGYPKSSYFPIMLHFA